MDKNRKQERNEDINSKTAHKSMSLGTLIVWNISKALEKSPHSDLKCAIKSAQARLERDVNVVISQCPEERHLECALLAWQQLGHNNADSLYKFYQTKKIEQERKATIYANKINDFFKILDITPPKKHKETKHSKATDSTSFISYSMGPVVKLPVQQKIVMRMENSGSVRQSNKKPRADEKNIMNKIDAACCLDTGCIERLSILDATTSELRLRAAKLAQREAERAELLERAEAAWKNLELGYHRRLMLAEEKEDDISKQIQKLIEERNNYKTVCTTLVQQLKERSEAAEKDRGKLTGVEKSVYDRACVRLRLNEQVAKGESALAELHCRGAQVDRDLQFKEEEARRKLRNMENETESVRALTHDTERAMRAELGALKEQVARVSQQLLSEDADCGRIKQELEELQQEKMGMVEDLDGCKVMCENRMQGRLDELKKKKQQLNELNEKVTECRCKFPIDATVEVKRTASLAALCNCTPEEKILESCSCTSLRSQLLSNLLADLFGGLLAELGWTGSQMPCQLLKCLEDKHNWDHTSVLKTNLRSFFAHLLVGELDIAIATSIEKYHAKWVGATCADIARIIPDTCEADHTGWQERAMERRAQKLATKLAEQLFQDRAEQLAQRAKEIVTSGPPPCECRPQSAVYPCILETQQSIAGNSKSGERTSHTWRRTLSDVTQLRLQVETLKKDSIKKADMKKMEETIAKLVERSSVQENFNTLTSTSIYNAVKSTKPLNLDYKKKTSFINTPKKPNKKVPSMKFQMDKSNKSFNNLKQTFAVNLCLCGTQTGANKRVQQDKNVEDTNLVQKDDKNSGNQRLSNVPIPQSPSIKNSKSINTQLSTTQGRNEKQRKTSINEDKNSGNQRTSNVLIPQLPSIKNTKSINTQLSTPQVRNEKQRKTSINEDNNSGNQRTSNVPVPQIPSIKKTKPINTQLSTAQEKNEKQSIKSTETVCPKDCVCFHKKPSSGSIDKLLKTIAKWKNDLTDSSVNQLKNKMAPRNSLISSEKNVKDRRMSKHCAHDQHPENKTIKTITKSSPKDFIGDDIDIKKANEMHIKAPGLIPKTTESEYIGAINLDKSNDSLCNCDNHEHKSNDISGQPNKYSNDCCCKNATAKNTILPENDLPSDNNIKGTGIEKMKSDEVLSCDCDVTLLGVTLADKKSKKRKKSYTYNSCDSDDDFDTGNDCHRRYKSNNNKKRSGRSGRTSRNNHLGNFISCNEPPTCLCQHNFHQMNDFVTGIDIIPKDVFMLHIDKGIDVSDTIEGELKMEPCVCCNPDVVETKDLEENTFHLLEEHLKAKLDEFKANSCRSSCIAPEEEEKLYTTLIHKVKQIILDTTNNISCRCSSKPPTQGSWNRAFSLLQEYLKAKIKRVQCHCTSKEDISPIDNVLDKVGKLIESDFDRLKCICKCNNVDVMHSINAVKEILCEEDIPVRDIYKPQLDCCLVKDVVQIHDSEKVLKCHADSINSTVLTKNISLQVPLNLSMESKACNVIEKGSINIQTSAIEKVCVCNECESTVSKSHNDCCCDSFCKDYTPVYKFGNELLVNHCTKLAQECDVNIVPKYKINCKSYSYPGLDPKRHTNTATENNKNLKNNETNTCNENFITSKTTHLPYVGYTVDCTCDKNIGACVCMKSVIQENNDKLADMWKTYSDYNKTHLKNVSYIMKNTSNIPTAVIYEVPEKIQKVLESNSEDRLKCELCEVKLSAHGEEDITLKESRDIIGGVHSAACALTESFNIETNCLIGNDSLDWCECSSRPINASNTDEYDKTVLSHVSSDIFEGDVVGDDVAMNQLPKNCNCDVVPICHVKMLVESIENKLIQSRCTCDSLVSVVCPIHASGFF